MKKFLYIAVAVIIISIIFSNCSSDSSNYGEDYNDNNTKSSYGSSKYDKDINDIADAYGKSSDEVNDVVQAMGGAMK